MLKKLGWAEGESLGKDNSGIQEPVSCYSNNKIMKINSPLFTLPFDVSIYFYLIKVGIIPDSSINV